MVVVEVVVVVVDRESGSIGTSCCALDFPYTRRGTGRGGDDMVASVRVYDDVHCTASVDGNDMI